MIRLMLRLLIPVLGFLSSIGSATEDRIPVLHRLGDGGSGCGIRILGCLLLSCAALVSAPTDPLLSSWFAAQTNFQTWSADFVQTRTLKSLTHPLTATGQVWFATPNRFYWELGKPAQTIAVRTRADLLVIYPKLERVERFPLSGNKGGAWREALSLLEAGFPRSEADLMKQFKILSQTVSNQTCELALQPKSSGARRMMPRIVICFDTRDFELKSTEMTFADGSTMRNDFHNPVLNPVIEPGRFDPVIDPRYKVVEPLSK